MASTKNRLHRAFGLDIAAHGDNTSYQFDANANLEVISLGLSRTGTTSLQTAFTKLGYVPTHGGIDLFRSMPRTDAFMDLYSKVISGVWSAGDPVLTARLRELMRGYRSITDTPIYAIVPETYAAYPDAKYILTVRPGGAEGWWRSFWEAGRWHIRRDWWRTWFRACIYPVQFLRKTDDKVQLLTELMTKRYGAMGPHWYDEHEALVKKTIPPEKLLVFDVREGWEPLCGFLGIPVPDEPFPNMNDQQAMRAIYVGFMSFGLFTWAMYVGSVAGVGYLAMNPQVVQDLVGRALGLGKDIAARIGWR